MAFCPNCGSRLNDGAKFCAACGRAATRLQQPIQPPRYAPPAPAKKKSAAPLVIGGIIGLCLVALIIAAISTSLFGILGGNDDTGGADLTGRPATSETAADSIPDGMPEYADGEMVFETYGNAVGLFITDTGESYFDGYLDAMIRSGWAVGEVPGTEKMYLAGKNNWAASLVYLDSTVIIMICPVVD